MLKREYRIKKKYQFNYVYRVGKPCHGKFLMLVWTQSKNQNVKIGISVSKKVGNAVKRNRARRLLREAISQFIPSLEVDRNIIIVAKQSIEGKPLALIVEDLKNTLKKSELFK